MRYHNVFANMCYFAEKLVTWIWDCCNDRKSITLCAADLIRLIHLNFQRSTVLISQAAEVTVTRCLQCGCGSCCRAWGYRIVLVPVWESPVANNCSNRRSGFRIVNDAVCSIKYCRGMWVPLDGFPFFWEDSAFEESMRNVLESILTAKLCTMPIRTLTPRPLRRMWRRIISFMKSSVWVAAGRWRTFHVWRNWSTLDEKATEWKR